MIRIKKSNKKQRRGQPRRRVKSFWQHSIFAVSFMIFILGGIGSGVWWVWHNDWLFKTAKSVKSSFILSAAKKGFVVRKILVKGRVETSGQDLLRALQLKRGTPILAFETELARIRVEALPWVQKAVVERKLPDVIHLYLIERRPLALWQRNGIFSLIDKKGRVIPLGDVSAYANLIVIIGDDAPTKAGNLFKVLAREPQLESQITAAVRVGGRRWNLHLNGQTEILLPEKGADKAWTHLAKLYKNHGLLFNDLKTIDLRLADRVVIRQGDNSVVKNGIQKIPEIQLKFEDKTHKDLKGYLRPNMGTTPISNKET
jgi:cell division protein FtsQ